MDPFWKATATFSGGRIDVWIIRAGSTFLVSAPQPSAAAATARSAVAATQSRSRERRFAAIGAGTPACEPPSAIHCSCSLMSCAVWNRSSGSFARQVLTTRSRPGGAIGEIEEIGGGSRSRIAAIMLARLLPANAFWPVTIS